MNSLLFSISRRLLPIGSSRGMTKEARGENIPRIFHEMQNGFLPRPELSDENKEFKVVLRNTTTLPERNKSFVSQFVTHDLTREQAYQATPKGLGPLFDSKEEE